jgi:Protein of unknown function (DUF551)
MTTFWMQLSFGTKIMKLSASNNSYWKYGEYMSDKKSNQSIKRINYQIGYNKGKEDAMTTLEEFSSEAYRKGYRSGYSAGVQTTFNPSLRWVSVKEKLPENDGYYLCTYIFDNHHFYYDRWFDKKDNEFTTTDNITHWMPLIEAPKGETE